MRAETGLIRENSLYFPCLTGNSGETGSLETPSTTTHPARFATFGWALQVLTTFQKLSAWTTRIIWPGDAAFRARPDNSGARLSEANSVTTLL